MLAPAKMALRLYDKPLALDFTEEEINFLEGYLTSKNYTVSYGFYKKISLKDKYLVVVIDTMPNNNRKSGAENNWELLKTRPVTAQEIREFIIFNYRTHYKRFLVYYYCDVYKIISEDLKLGAETPKEFIKACELKYNKL